MIRVIISGWPSQILRMQQILSECLSNEERDQVTAKLPDGMLNGDNSYTTFTAEFGLNVNFLDKSLFEIQEFIPTTIKIEGSDWEYVKLPHKGFRYKMITKQEEEEIFRQKLPKLPPVSEYKKQRFQNGFSIPLEKEYKSNDYVTAETFFGKQSAVN